MALATLFWRDMVGVASLLNLAASVAAMMLAAGGAPLALAVALHFSPLPYNLFLFAAVWRHRRRSALVGVAALAWLVLASLL